MATDCKRLKNFKAILIENTIPRSKNILTLLMIVFTVSSCAATQVNDSTAKRVATTRLYAFKSHFFEQCVHPGNLRYRYEVEEHVGSVSISMIGLRHTSEMLKQQVLHRTRKPFIEVGRDLQTVESAVSVERII